MDANEKVVEFSEHLTKKVKNDFCHARLVKFSSKTLQRIMLNQDLYLPGDVLSLRCECLFQGEELDRYIEKKSRLTVRNYIQVAPFLTNSDSGQSFLDNSNHMKGDVQGRSAYPSLNNDLRTMFEDEGSSDYTIQTQAKSFPVHKTVLCARSSVFRAMLTSEMKEGHSNSMDIPDVDADTLHRFILFLYTDEFDAEMSWESASKLYSVADKYEVLLLRDRCGSLLKSSLSTTNACDVLSLSDLHQDDDLKKTALDYIWKHYNDMMDSEQWKKLESENGPLAFEALKGLYKQIRNS